MSIYFDEFETLYGISENIQALRKKILDLAFKGKLTQQKHSETKADEIFEKLLIDRKKLIKDKIVRKPRKARGKKIEEPKYKLPSGWKWINLIDSFGTFTPPKKLKTDNIHSEGNIPVVSQSQDKTVGYTNDEEAKITIDKPCIVFGDHTTEIKYIDFDFAVGSDGTKLIQPVNFNEKLFYYYLKYLDIQQEGYKRHFSKLKVKLIPLIPIKEQQQIVEKIEFLMKEVDALEEKLKEKENVSEKLSQAVVEQINESKSTDELEENLRFIIENFDVIFETPDSMDELRNIVLQLAIEGKLVKQDENDEPASELIKRIEEEKKELINEGEIKKSRSKIKPIKEDEVPFEIPTGWAFAKFGDITFKITDGAHKTPKYVKKGIPFLSVKDMSSGYLDFSDTKFIREKEHERIYSRCNTEKGDILLTKVGTTGIPIIVDVDKEFSLFVSVALLKFSKKNIYNKYLKYCIMSPFVKGLSEENTKGVGNKNLVLRDIKNFTIPIPPINEQKRIVEKVDSIMKIIDKMEEELEKKYDIVEKLGSV